MRFTLVSTIYNEAKRLGQTIADLEAQTLAPTEIIITDAGSNDGSWDILLAWQQRSTVPIVLLQESRCNVARGRNLAIEKASHELIVSTDFGCRFHPQWLESIVTPFKNEAVKVVGGAFTVIEEEILTNAAKGNYLLTNGYKVELNDSFIPSSRSIAYKKSVWEQIGGYCEWLTLAADDLVFGLQIRSLGIDVALINNPYVYWGRHTSKAQYNKEAYRYGLGDGEANVNLRNFTVSTAEYLLRMLLLLSVLASTILFFFNSPLVYFTLVLCFVGTLGFRPYMNVFNNWMRIRSAKYDLKIFLLSLTMLEEQRYNYIKGYLKGFLFSKPTQKREAKILHTKLK